MSAETYTTISPQQAKSLYQALSAESEELFAILQTKDCEVLRAALKNPNLNENHLLSLLKRHDLTEETIKTVYKLSANMHNHQITVALVHNPSTPGTIIITLLPQLYLFEQVAVCYLPGVTADQKLAAERAIIQRLTATPLGSKLTLARRGTATIIEALLKEGNPQLLETCLDNPRLKESGVYQFLSSRNATPETISLIARHPKWKSRPNLKLAILKNPKTPTIWLTLFMPTISTIDLQNLLLSRNHTAIQKNHVTEELHKRGIV